MKQRRAMTSEAVGVQLGLIITPMLDMSFQILAFFIMTYHPSALEGHIPGALAPPDNFAKKSKDNTNPVPKMEDPLSIPEEDLLPELQEAVQVRIKANLAGQGNDKLVGTPQQVLIKTGIQTEETLIADNDVDFDVALKRLAAKLKEMAGANMDKANFKIAADGELRQQYIMQVYDVAKKANYKNVHFVPPPVLNTKIDLKK